MYGRWTQHGDWLNADDWQDDMAPRRTMVVFDWVERAKSGRTSSVASAFTAEQIAARLRWGGRALVVSRDFDRAKTLQCSLDGTAGLVVEQSATAIHGQHLGLRLPGVTPSGFVTVLRRVTQNDLAGQRCTFDMTLCPGEGADQLCKAVPSVDDLLSRLRARHRDRDDGDLVALAERLARNVLPTALTREVAVLEHLASRMPADLRDRVPTVTACERDPRGFVRSLRMNWLEPATAPMGHLPFALEATELLAVLHQRAQIAHLDLRAENLHLTDRGVCLVDFGNAIRLDTAPPADSVQRLHRSLGRGSAIRRRLMAAARRQAVDAQAVELALREPGPALDTLCLALMLPRPDRTLTESELVRVFPSSQPAPGIATLVNSILRPRDPFDPRGKTAADLNRGLSRLAERQRAIATQRDAA